MVTKHRKASPSKPVLAEESEVVEVPFLRGPQPAKAPATDPYLRPGTVTSNPVTFGGVSLPHILSGIQPGQGLDGQPVDYRVSVMWVSRRQIEAALDVVASAHPDTSVVMEVVRSYIGHLDSMRDDVKLGGSVALQSIKAGDSRSLELASRNLETTIKLLGRWNDEQRLHLDLRRAARADLQH